MKNLLPLLIFLAPLTSFCQYGVLDPNFDADGILSFEVGISGVTRAHDVAVQEDGKILVLGRTEFPQPAGFSTYLIRLFPDGTVDQSFGQTGAVLIDGDLREMTIQADGNIVLVGSGTLNNTDAVVFVRLNGADGSPDTSFGVNGSYRITTLPQGSFLRDVAIQADGKIVATGFSTESDTEVLLVRLNSDGFPDLSFSFDGIVVTDASGVDFAGGLVIGEDGKITVAGATNNDGLLIRYNTDGTLDNSFGINGIAVQNIGIGSSFFNDIVKGEGNKMYVCGFFNGGSDNDFLLAKFNDDGTPDETFASLGYSLNDFGSNDYDEAMELLYQPDGRILVVGEAVFQGSSVGALVRHNVDGTFDNSFGNSGFVVTSIGAGNVYEGVALQEDLKILTVGRSIAQSLDEEANVVRYTSGMNVGIGEVEASIGSTLIYPNPITDNHLTVEYELTSLQSVSIELIDLNGKLISVLQPEAEEASGDYQKQLDLGNVPSGNYLLRLRTEKGALTVKVTVS